MAASAKTKTKTNVANYLRALKKVSGVMKEELTKLAKQEAAGFVKEVVNRTPPSSPGGNRKGVAAKKAGEAAVDRDLNAIFRPVKIKGRRVITHLFGDKNPNVRNKPPYVVPTTERHPDVKFIYEWRKNRKQWRGRKRLTRGQKAAYYVDARKLKQLSKEQKASVGTLAGGYNAAAVKLGVKQPAWIARHGTKYGSISIRVGSASFMVVIMNRVPYALEQDLNRWAELALKIQQAKFERRLPHVLRAAVKKAGLRQAA